MAIRKKLSPNDPVLIHRLSIEPATHPLLHAKLFALGLGSSRTSFIRDNLEALLAGGSIDLTESSPPQIAPVAHSLEAPPTFVEAPAAVPLAEVPETEEEAAKRRAAATALVKKSQF